MKLDHSAYLGLVGRLTGGRVVCHCALCFRPIRAIGGILEHQRGRSKSDGSHAPLLLDDLSWDELEALGLCECGTSLNGHPPLPQPGPLSSRVTHNTGSRGYMPAWAGRARHPGNG